MVCSFDRVDAKQKSHFCISDRSCGGDRATIVIQHLCIMGSSEMQSCLSIDLRVDSAQPVAGTVGAE